MRAARVVAHAAVLLAAFAAVLAWDWLFENPFCDVLFRCGCTFNFLGGWDRCNVFDPDPAPHCPFCSAQWPWVLLTKFYVLAWLFFAVLWLVLTLVVRQRWALALPLVGLASAVAYFVFGATIGLGFKLATGYPYFIWK